jgi:hypothetical protein
VVIGVLGCSAGTIERTACRLDWKPTSMPEAGSRNATSHEELLSGDCESPSMALVQLILMSRSIDGRNVESDCWSGESL